MNRRESVGLIGFGALGMAGMSSAAKTQTDVLVFGAGAAGLHAARELEKAGYDVVVLEGSTRVGGRCWTGYGVPGRPEFGASEIPGTGRIVDVCRELGVRLQRPSPLQPSESTPPQLAVSLGGRPAEPIPWKDSPLNRLVGTDREVSPMQLWLHYAFKKTWFPSKLDWFTPEFAPLDRMSIAEYYRSVGASPEALRVIGIGNTTGDLEDQSAVDVLRRAEFVRRQAKKGTRGWTATDGTESITTAMAHSLAQRPRLDHAVTHVELTRDGVRARCANGTEWSARAAVCTLPFSTLKRVKVTGDVDPVQREAWRSIPYANFMGVYLDYDEPFWREDGMAGTTWTDGPIELVLHTWSATKPDGLLYAHFKGGTPQFRGMDDREIGAFVVRELARIRPASLGKVRFTHLHNWQRYPFALGHKAFFKPGQVQRYFLRMIAPAGNLFFAGEHCAREQLGVEGACESAEAAVVQVRERLQDRVHVAA